jgi:hypothetical protein
LHSYSSIVPEFQIDAGLAVIGSEVPIILLAYVFGQGPITMAAETPRGRSRLL